MEKVEHDAGSCRFHIGGAFLQYERLDNGTLDFHHTETPPALQGRGLAGKIVRAAVEHVQSSGGKIRPSCSYVEHWFIKNPEFQDV
ncbi:MAG: hypothetical protein SGCHY_005225, partial [Lobulomycetales sp.]